MPKIRADRVKETSITEGTGDIVLLGAALGFRTFSAVCIEGSTFDYGITHEGTGSWESGVGTYKASTNSVERTTVTASSNSGSAVNFAAGYKQIFITLSGASTEEIDRTLTKATALSVVFGG
jgi:hypothetical protein